MAIEFIKEQVDIYQLPSVDLTHKGTGGAQITIGDLHANTMKLMFMLVKHGIATNINKEDYNRLVKIYKTETENLTKELLGEFTGILGKLKFNSDSTIRLIGDELADRGNNDYFTLKILEKLKEHKVPVEIIVSNHSIEFIEAYERQEDFLPRILLEEHSESIRKLQRLVESGIVTRDEILDIAEKAYKPTLRAISYSLSEDNKEITIYSHAGIGLDSIKDLAQKLEVEYKDTTAVCLAQTINKINEQFQKHVQNDTVHTLYTSENMWAGYLGENLSDAPFEFIMWNRRYYSLDRPKDHYDYKINFVHGHDSEDLTKDNIYNLDNSLGKGDYGNQGSYTVLYSRKSAVTPSLKSIEKEVAIEPPAQAEIKAAAQQQLQKEAQQVIANYIKKINQFAVDFSGVRTSDGVKTRAQQLLTNLAEITGDKGNLSEALTTPGIDRKQSDAIKCAMANKREEINAAAQQFKDQKQKEAKINALLLSIDTALENLAQRVREVNPNQFRNAYDVALALVNNLKNARDRYKDNMTLRDSLSDELFKNTCREEIQNAMPVLQNALGWGDYLTNLLKIMANAIIKVVTLGHRNNFFTLVQPAFENAVRIAEQDLQIDNVPSPS
ncbi:Dot/Icm T4SS effector Wip [Legionella maioricensis]|uniref:WipA-like phosphatase domain-containing protein n=1 Tax=Legionella maioricensis TaxID=2896528 RepID=A0A9X2CZT4_9GAMM|nr:Dot/Icm T4SS effector Wip [Legionella maioricensis]MCL9683732.1 hypothetical protein [Legionella maioricensis]MCL9687506.1 hypothetical protein [Legionella maioricensis]